MFFSAAQARRLTLGAPVSCPRLATPRIAPPPTASILPASAGQGDAGLSLVSEHDLESRLAVRNFAAVVLREWKPVLARLDRRLAWISGVDGLDIDLNPIGPEHIGVAVHEAFGVCDLAAEVRLVLIKLCEREFAVQVGRIYRDVDERLAQAGVMPAISSPMAP